MTVLQESAIADRMDQGLSVVLRRAVDGPELVAVPLEATDLAEIRALVWRDGCLRQGRPDLPLDQARIEVVGLVQEGTMAGLRLLITQPNGTVFSRTFGLGSFAHVARRGQKALLAASVLKAGDVYHYGLEFRPSVATDAAGPKAWGIKVRPRSVNHPVLHGVDRASLVRQARRVGPDTPDFPVFYTEAALAHAEAVSRRGGLRQPPRETGVMLVGVRAACTDGELAVIVFDALELMDAAADEFQLRPSARTYTHLDAGLQTLRQRPGGRTLSLVGQAHGHPFLPGRSEEGDCTSCPRRATCPSTSASPSADDGLFMRALYRGIPWALCHIFGCDARGVPVANLFTLDARSEWTPRGYFVLPSFDLPAQATL